MEIVPVPESQGKLEGLDTTRKQKKHQIKKYNVNRDKFELQEVKNNVISKYILR